MVSSLKGDKATSLIPMMLLRAKAGKASRIVGLEEGADAFLEKPFEPSELQLQVKSLTAPRNALREYVNSEDAKLKAIVRFDPEKEFITITEKAVIEHLGDPKPGRRWVGAQALPLAPTIFEKVQSDCRQKRYRLYWRGEP